MIEFFNRLFGRQNSGATAKERLRLVLMSDHLSLAPEMIDSMKRDLVDVISKYVQVDREKIDVHFENQDNALAMLANIPITGVNRNGGDGGDAVRQAQDDKVGDAAEATASTSQQHGASKGTSKRKRRKSGGQNGQAPHNGTPAPAT
jgi:cell division topological specificity factor